MASKKPMAKPMAVRESLDGQAYLYAIDWKKGYVLWLPEDADIPIKSKLYGKNSISPYFKRNGQIEYLDDFIPTGEYRTWHPARNP